jgi:hypothetical protein
VEKQGVIVMTPSSHDELNSIWEKLSEIQASIEGNNQKNTEIFRSINMMLSNHERIFHGSNGDPGMIKDVDRLKEHRKGIEKQTVIVWAAMVPLMLKALVDFLTRK